MNSDLNHDPGPEPTASAYGTLSDQIVPGSDNPETLLKRLAPFLQPTRLAGYLGRLEHYEIEGFLGRGVFGIVAKALDTKLQRPVAIKILSPELATTSPPRKRFLREARLAASIHHENIVAIHAVEEEPIPYLVMEYIPGVTLQNRIEEHGPIDYRDVVRIGRQISAGLAAAHASQLIHRDIKPANILLQGAQLNPAKLTDFGLARAVDDASMSASGTITGTPMYMSPEQARGEKLDHQSDLFSLGTVLYQMVSGRPPFRAPSAVAVMKRICEDTPRNLQEILPEIPLCLSQLIFKLMEKTPEDRWPSAAAVAEQLGQWEREILVHGNVLDPGKRLSPRRSPAKFTVGVPGLWLGIMVAVMVFGTAWLAWWAFQTWNSAPPQPPAATPLAMGTAWFEVYYKFPQARFRIDDREYRTSQLVPGLPLSPGSHTVTYILDDVELFQKSFEIVAGQDTVVDVIDPDRGVANAVFEFGDAGIHCRVNDQVAVVSRLEDLPKTPFRLTQIAFGLKGPGDEMLARMGPLQHLEELRIRSPRVTLRGLEAFRNSLTLKSLLLYEPNVDDRVFELLATIPHLQRLVVQDCMAITDGELYRLGVLKELTDLNLSGTAVTGTGLASLSEKIPLHALRLWKTPVTIDGLKTIAGFKELRYLELGDCLDLTGEGLSLLVKLPLETLDLRGCKPDDGCFAALSQMTQLKHLDLGRVEVTQERLAQLRQALPTTTISN